MDLFINERIDEDGSILKEYLTNSIIQKLSCVDCENVVRSMYIQLVNTSLMYPGQSLIVNKTNNKYIPSIICKTIKHFEEDNISIFAKDFERAVDGLKNQMIVISMLKSSNVDKDYYELTFDELVLMFGEPSNCEYKFTETIGCGNKTYNPPYCSRCRMINCKLDFDD